MRSKTKLKDDSVQNQSVTYPAHLLNVKGAFLCKDVIPKDLCHFLTHVMLRKHSIEGQISDKQVTGSLTYMGHELFLETLQETIWPKLEIILGEELLPTYTYSRLYTNGNVLKPHKDRPECEISITVQLGRSHHYSWPIYVEGDPFYLAEGDGIIYRGCDVSHWRDSCDGPEDYYSGQVFFHFVRKNQKNIKLYGDPEGRGAKTIPKDFYVKNRDYLMETK
jgi:hypothetical protein